MLMFARLSGSLCVLALSVMASHAELAGPDDVTIKYNIDFRYCLNGSDKIVAPARPLYYVELICTDFHSSDPLLHPVCHNVFPSSHCTIQDCEHDSQRLGTSPHPLSGAATQEYVCAVVNGNEWTLIDQLSSSQENTELPAESCEQTAFKSLIPSNYQQVCQSKGERSAACTQLNDTMIADALPAESCEQTAFKSLIPSNYPRILPSPRR
jgi:hypothetical protein